MTFTITLYQAAIALVIAAFVYFLWLTRNTSSENMQTLYAYYFIKYWKIIIVLVIGLAVLLGYSIH